MSYKQIMKLFIVYLNENNYSFVILPFKRRDQDFNLRLKINKNILCSKGGGVCHLILMLLKSPPLLTREACVLN